MESILRVEDLEANAAVDALLCTSPEIQDSEVVIASDSNEEPVTRCSVCMKDYATIANLRRHMHAVHGQQYVELPGVKGQIKCMYDSQCEASFNRTVQYRRHLTHVHGVKLEMVVKHFSSMEEFLKWKTAEENATESLFNKFVRNCAGRLRAGHMKRISYVCHRSGKCLQKGNKKRSMKIGSYCPAKMEIYYSNELVIVKYFKTHVGHGSLNEFYKTSLKKRMQSAVRRQRKAYRDLKNEIKAKVELFLEDLVQDKFSVDFLKHISASFNSVFDPKVDPSDNSVTETLKGCPVLAQNGESCHPVNQSGENGEISENKTMVLTEKFSETLSDHRYVSRNALQQKSLPYDKYVPAIVHLSKESKSVCESSNDLSIESNVTVSATPCEKNTIQSEFLGEHVKQNCPVIILDARNVLLRPKLQSTPSPVQKKAEILFNPIFSKGHKATVPLSAETKGKLDNDQKLSPKNKRELLEALWNSYKNS